MIVGVTGGDGFIGRVVERELLQRGHHPVCIDRATGINIVDAGSVRDALTGADGVIHLAGVLGTSELFQEPEKAVETNILGTISVLKACAAENVKYVGITMPQVWDNVYQVTKNAAVGLSTAWHKHFGVAVSHVRAYNVFGIGQKVGSPQKIVPTFAAAAWAKEKLPIWGDGLQTVDLVWVEDVARMLVDALDYGDCQTFDAGTGHQTTVKEVAALVWDFVNGEVDMDEHCKFYPMRKGENEATKVAASGEGWDLLGWSPSWRPQELQRTVLSYRP